MLKNRKNESAFGEIERVSFRLALGIYLLAWFWVSLFNFTVVWADGPEKKSPPTRQEKVILFQPPLQKNLLEKRGTGNLFILPPGARRNVKLWDEVSYPSGKESRSGLFRQGNQPGR